MSLVPIRNLAHRGDYLQSPLLGISVNADFRSAPTSTEKRSGIGILHNEENKEMSHTQIATMGNKIEDIRLMGTM